MLLLFSPWPFRRPGPAQKDSTNGGKGLGRSPKVWKVAGGQARHGQKYVYKKNIRNIL